MTGDHSTPWPEVQIIVTHWNDEETTTACLQYLKTIEYPNMQVTVVDSGSTDGSGGRLQENFPWVRVVRLAENRGHAFAANAGAAAAETPSPYVFFLDNDAFVERGCLNELVGNLQQNPNAAIACPLILSQRKPGRVWYAGGSIAVFGDARHTKMGKRLDQSVLEPASVDFATACALLVRRSIFEETCGFTPELVTYSDDLELSIKVREAGHSILYVPSARVHHGESRNVIKVAGKRFRDYYSMRNRLYVVRKYGTVLQKSLGVLLLIFWYAFLYGCVHALRGEWKRSRALFLGVKDFFQGRMGWRDL